MEYAVAYDGTPLSDVALRRARAVASADDEIIVITVVPVGNTSWARERGWLGDADDFDLDRIREGVAESVREVVPDARFGMGTVGKRAPPGTIGSELRKRVVEVDPDIVVVGSDSAGRIAGGIGSVASSVISEESYDVLVVRPPDS